MLELSDFLSMRLDQESVFVDENGHLSLLFTTCVSGCKDVQDLQLPILIRS